MFTQGQLKDLSVWVKLFPSVRVDLFYLLSDVKSLIGSQLNRMKIFLVLSLNIFNLRENMF